MPFLSKFFVVLLFVSSFTTASAAIVINEIMYDLKEGSDTGREWIELTNTGTANAILTDWKLREGNANHALTLSRGSETIPPGGFAIIVSDTAKFLADNPNFSGTIFDSSFSLANTGESLSIRDASLTDVDSVTYTSSQGGAGDGDTLQKIGNTWQGGIPTPGAVNTSFSSINPSSSQQETSPGSTTNAGTSNVTNSSSFPIEPQIFASAGEKKRVATVGGVTIFSGMVWGIKKEPIENARMLWNFGDGSTGEGKATTHTYRYPGTYIVTLNASSGYYSASDRVTIQATNADIIISSVGNSPSSFIELYNKSPYELDLSSWSIHGGKYTFIIPEHTFIASSGKIKFTGDITGIVSSESVPMALYYPNGSLAHSYSPAHVSNFSASSSPMGENNKSTSIKNMIQEKSETNKKSTTTTIFAEHTILQKELSDEPPQTALVSNIGTEPHSLFWWIMAVGTLAFAGILAVFFAKRNQVLEPLKNEVDAYEIIEEAIDDKIPF